MPFRYSFKAYERLKKEQDIKTLFQKGKAFSSYPIQYIWAITPKSPKELSPIRVGVSVPKRKFPNAVDRNYLKRLLREVWRLNKHCFYANIPEHIQMHLFLVYTDKTPCNIIILQQSLDLFLEKIKKINFTQNA